MATTTCFCRFYPLHFILHEYKQHTHTHTYVMWCTFRNIVFSSLFNVTNKQWFHLFVGPLFINIMLMIFSHNWSWSSSSLWSSYLYDDHVNVHVTYHIPSIGLSSPLLPLCISVSMVFFFKTFELNVVVSFYFLTFRSNIVAPIQLNQQKRSSFFPLRSDDVVCLSFEKWFEKSVAKFVLRIQLTNIFFYNPFSLFCFFSWVKHRFFQFSIWIQSSFIRVCVCGDWLIDWLIWIYQLTYQTSWQLI